MKHRSVSRPTISELGDFTVKTRTITISLIAVGVGILSCAVALGLLKLIALFTNIAFFMTFDFADRTPAQHSLGPFVIAIPVIGSLIIGLMARYGSERIRGHGRDRGAGREDGIACDHLRRALLGELESDRPVP